MWESIKAAFKTWLSQGSHKTELALLIIGYIAGLLTHTL